MKLNNDYYKQREINCLDKIDKMLEDMPNFCGEFFIGISNNTSPLTRLNYCYDLRIFFDFIIKTKYQNLEKRDLIIKDLENLEIDDFEQFMSYLSRYKINGKIEMCNERAKSRKLATIRTFYKYFFNKGKIVANTASKIPMPKKHEKEIIRLEVNEVVNLLDSVESGDTLQGRQKSYQKNTQIRDTAILTLFLGTGIRNSELVGLNLDDIDFENQSMRITRKGGSRTVLYFNDEVKVALLQWINYRSKIEDLDKDEKALFLSLQNRRISTRAIQDLVKKYSSKITPLKKITPHKLRSTFGTNLYRETNDIYLVADLLGHSDVNTTKKHYAATSDDMRRNAVKFVNLKKDNNDT